jgi:hypothetical protein
VILTRRLPLQAAIVGSDFPSSVAHEHESLSKLYVLAEKLINDMTKEMVLAAILARFREPCPDNVVHLRTIKSIYTIYCGTSEHSPARQLFVIFFTDFCHVSFATTDTDELPSDFLNDLSQSLLATRPLVKDHDKLKGDLARKEEQCREMERSQHWKKNRKALGSTKRTWKPRLRPCSIELLLWARN